MMLTYAYIVGNLLARNLTVLLRTLHTRLLDNCITVTIMAIQFGYLLPLMGMKPTLSGPMLVGTLVHMTFHIGYSTALTRLYDLEYNRFINYHLTLALPTMWLFASYLITFFIEASVIIIPLMCFGIFLLGSKFIIIKTSFIALCIIYILGINFIGLLFLYCSFAYPLDWVKANLWIRRLSWLFIFSSTLFPWQPVYQYSPFLGTLFLLSPMTYIADGLRSALIGGTSFIPVWYCIGILIPFLCCLIIALRITARRRLDTF